MRIRFEIALFLLCASSAYSFLVASRIGFPFKYFTAPITDTIVVVCLTKFNCYKITRDIQILGICLVIAHFYGLVIYMIYLAPTTYNYLQTILIFAQFARLFFTDDSDDFDDNTDNNKRIDSMLDSYSNLSRSARKESYK